MSVPRPSISSSDEALVELNELLGALPVSLDPGEVAATLLERCARLFRSPLAGVWLELDGEPELVGTFGLTDKKAEQLWGALELQAAEPAPLNLFAERLAGAGAFGKRRLGALLAVPLRVQAGLIGWLVFARLEPSPYSAFEEETVGLIARRAAVALDNARLYRQTERRSRELAVLSEISALLVSTTRLQDLLDAIVQRVVEAFGLTLATVQLLDPERGILPATAGYHRDPRQLAETRDFLAQAPLRPDKGFTAEVFRTRRPYMSQALQDDPLALPEIQRFFGPGAVLVLPLLVRDEPIGGMYLFKAGRHAQIAPATAALAEQLAGQIAVALENARLYAALERRVDERDTRLQALYEELARRMNDGRSYMVDLSMALRADLEAIAGADDADRTRAIARMRARLDDLDRRLVEGEGRPF